MKRTAPALLLLFPIFANAQPQKGTPHTMFVMHGGAGTITRQNMTPEPEKHIRETMKLALRTGTGESFIRWTMAYDIAALGGYKGLSVEQAGHEVINDKLVKVNGDGGAIILDRKGNFATPFNTEG